MVVPARALFELAGLPGVRSEQVERAVDNAWAQRLVSGRTLHSLMAQLQHRRWHGTQVMRSILAERGEAYVPPASNLEARVVRILHQAGEPSLRRQVNCGDEDGWIGRVDFIDDEVPFVLEVQSERFHSSLLDQKADCERIARLEAAGYVVATVTETDVWHRPSRVLKIVRDGREAARDRLFIRG